jgi:hypothetical protein
MQPVPHWPAPDAEADQADAPEMPKATFTGSGTAVMSRLQLTRVEGLLLPPLASRSAARKGCRGFTIHFLNATS